MANANMKGYWMVAVQEVKKMDVWKSCIPAWEKYVADSNGECKPVFFGRPSAVFEAGIDATTAIIEFPSLEKAMHARMEDTKYTKDMIEADGTPVENKIRRDFRVLELPGDWLKPGKGYWVVWVRETKDKETWVGKCLAAWENYVASGACIVHHLKPPHAVFEDGRMLTIAVCEFPSVQAAIAARNSPEYVDGVLGAGGKPVEEMIIRDFRIIGIP